MSSPDQGLRRALEAAGVPLAILDHEGVIESVNIQFAALFSSTPDSLIGRHLVALCDPTAAGATTSALVRIIGGVSKVEMVTIHPDTERCSWPVSITITASHDDDRTDQAIFCIASPTGASSVESTQQVRDTDDYAQGTATSDSEISDRIESSIERSAACGKPFALLVAAFADRDGAGLDDTIERIVVARIIQRLRSSDSVIHHGAGRVLFLAEQLGTEQDAVGVAYRMLSTTIDPVRTSSSQHDVLMTIGIAVGDKRSTPPELITAGEGALAAAMVDGLGGFRTVDTRSESDSDGTGPDTGPDDDPPTPSGCPPRT